MNLERQIYSSCVTQIQNSSAFFYMNISNNKINNKIKGS